MTMLSKPDHWFLDMTAEEAARVIPLGHCTHGPDCGCWWDRRLASARSSAAMLAAAFPDMKAKKKS